MFIYFRLFYEFFKVGLFAVGGGLATLPFLQDIGQKTGWFSQMQLADMVAISEATPGPIGVNMATYVGFETCGVVGSVVATLGLITPSIIVILVISAFLKKYQSNKYVQAAFYGLRAASMGLIASAFLSISKTSLFIVDVPFLESFNYVSIIMFICLFIGIKKINVHPAFFLGLSALLGIILKL